MSKQSIVITFLVLVIGLGTIIPFLRAGFFEFHDNTSVVRVAQMSKVLEAGVFPVRWVPDLGYGYGYPIYNFYAPLPYYIGGILPSFGLGSLASTKVMIVFGSLLSGVTMFFLARRFFGNFGGFLSSVVYLYFPYHAVNIYVRGAVGELYAYAFLPLVFLGLLSLAKVGKIRELVKNPSLLLPFIFGIFFVAVSHNLTILMTFIVLAPAYLSLLFLSKRRKILTIGFVVSLILGMGLSAFYTIPAFMEMGYTNVSSQVGGGADYRDHYVCISQLWSSQWGYGGSIPGCTDGLSFMLGKMNILIVGVVTVLLAFSIVRRKINFHERVVMIAIFLLIISILLSTQVTAPVWNNFGYMAYIQYPWRFLNFAGLFIAFIAGYLFFVIKKKGNIEKTLILFALSFVIVAISYKYFTPQYYNSYDDRYYNDEVYVKYTVSKISDEYLPKSFSKPESAEDIPTTKIIVKEGQGVTTTTKQTPIRIEGKYSFNSDGMVHVNISYFPAWKVYVDGKKTTISEANNGFEFPVKKGNGNIEIKFQQTIIEVLGNTVSIVVLFTLLIGIMLTKSYGKKTS